MKLLHVTRGDEIVGDRIGLVFRNFSGLRDFDVLLIVPIPGRFTMFEDHWNVVVRNSRVSAWVGFSRHPKPRFMRGLVRRGDGYKETGHHARVVTVP